ncbi:MAG: lipocalin family protein [Deltaproteobacteria bacterium]|nr:lipocalin family protein [Deltaproteobacteria bacterium]
MAWYSHSRASFQAKSDRILADQELNTGGSTGVIYWEGAVAGGGTSGGLKVSCEGYVELTGYAGSLGGLF